MERTKKKSVDAEWRPKKFLKVYEGFIPMFGTTKAVLLSVYINRYDISKRYKKLKNGSFYLLRRQIEKQTGYDKVTIIKHTSELKDEHILETVIIGRPPKQWYTINFGEIAKRLNRTKSSTNTNRTKNSTISQNSEIRTSPHLMDDISEKPNRTKSNTNKNKRTISVLNITNNKTLYDTFLTEGFTNQWTDNVPFKFAIRRWFKHLEEKGRSYTPTQLEQEAKGLLKDYNSPEKATTAINHSIRRGWLSIHPEPDPDSKDKKESKKVDKCPCGWIFGKSYSYKVGCIQCEDNHPALHERCSMAHKEN